MRLLTRSILTVSFLALAAAVVWPQSLGEVAAREKERQEKVKRKAGGPAKVITENDLRGRGAGTYSQPGATSAATPSASPSPGAAPGAEKPKTADEVRADQTKAWRERLQNAMEEVTRLSGIVDGVQRDLADNSTVAVYGPGRTRMLNQLDEAQKALATARQKVDAIQEEGRRMGLR
jgi:hypothetical protein